MMIERRTRTESRDWDDWQPVVEDPTRYAALLDPGDRMTIDRVDGLSVQYRRLVQECATCATPLASTDRGRTRQYCSDACRQAAYRRRSV
jgi:hypothetical protein